MAGCSVGDFVGHESALSRTVAAGAEGADPTSLILGWPEDESGACSPCRFQTPSLGKQRYMGHTHQESTRPDLFPVFLHCLSTSVVAGSLSTALAKPGLAELDPDLQD